MSGDISFIKTIDVLQRNMDTASLRRQVIANNIANAETPNFKRSHMNYEAELSRALASEKLDTSIGVLTHERHIPFRKSIDYRDVRPKIVLDYLTAAKNNGNNVDIERELLEATKNQMLYELMSSAVGFQFGQIDIVLS